MREEEKKQLFRLFKKHFMDITSYTFISVIQIKALVARTTTNVASKGPRNEAAD